MKVVPPCSVLNKGFKQLDQALGNWKNKSLLFIYLAL